MNFSEWKNDNVSMKISWKFSLSLISIALLSHVCVFLLKISKMCCINILGQTIVRLDVYEHSVRIPIQTIGTDKQVDITGLATVSISKVLWSQEYIFRQPDTLR